MKRLALALSVTCLAVVAIVAARAILSDDGGAESAAPVPTASRDAVRPERCVPELAPARGGVDNGIWRKAPRGAPKVDYVLDLSSGAMKPLPDSIIRTVADPDEGQLGIWSIARYAASRDGSQLAFVGRGEEGSLQIFIAGIDGSGVRQVTHAPRGAMSPAWSPDASMIAYNQQADLHGTRVGGSRNWGLGTLFVLDVATGESTRLPEAGLVAAYAGHQFTPGGSSLLYTSGRQGVLRTVPIDGGKSTVFIGPDEGMAGAGNGSLSPDGSLVTMMGEEMAMHRSPMCGGGALRYVSNADGAHLAKIPGRESRPAGTWSPEGKRIVTAAPRRGVIVVDVATGRASPVARVGDGAIWLDRHTLLVDARCAAGGRFC